MPLRWCFCTRRGAGPMKNESGRTAAARILYHTTEVPEHTVLETAPDGTRQGRQRGSHQGTYPYLLWVSCSRAPHLMANLTPPGRVALPGHVHHSTVASFENETAQMPQKIKMLDPSLSTGDSNASPESTSFPRL